MPKSKLLNLLLALATLSAVLGLVTLIPFPANHIKSDLGYISLCPFAPWSTLMLLVFAGLVWVVRGYLKTSK